VKIVIIAYACVNDFRMGSYSHLVVYATDSLSMLWTIETGMYRIEWLESIL